MEAENAEFFFFVPRPVKQESFSKLAIGRQVLAFMGMMIQKLFESLIFVFVLHISYLFFLITRFGICVLFC